MVQSYESYAYQHHKCNLHTIFCVQWSNKESKCYYATYNGSESCCYA